MANATDSVTAVSHIPGITSMSFHVSLWIFSMLGIVGNTLVLVWRCTRPKDSRYRLVSLLIINLAFSDLLFCIQYVLREIMLVRPIFHYSADSSYPYTDTDSGLCVTAIFLTYASCNCVVTTALAIALHTFLSVREDQWTKPIVVTVVAAGWTFSLVVAGLATSNLKTHENFFFHSPDKSAEAFSLIAIYGCFGDDREEIYPVLVTGLNVVSTMMSCFLYAGFCIRIRNIRNLWGCSTINKAHRKRFVEMQIRFACIAVLNLASWWPACILYWYSYFSNRTVFKGNFNPKTPEAAFLFTVIVSATNPFLYTVSCKYVTKLLRRRRRSENERCAMLERSVSE